MASIPADPYPWPWDGVIAGPRTALVVAGAQVAFAARSVGVAAAQEVIGRVASRLRAIAGLVVVVRHAAPPGARGPLPPAAGAPGWALVHEAGPDDLVVDAGGLSAFAASTLDGELRHRGIDHLVLCGYGHEAAVDSTLRAANDRGYECLTLVDGVAPFAPDTGAHALSSTTMSGGIFGAIATSEAFLAALPVPLEV